MRESKQIKRVALVGPAHPLRGGIANFNEALARALQSEGFEVRLFSFKLQYPSFLFPGTTQFDNGQPPGDIAIETIINSINPFNWILSAVKIANHNPDLVVVRFWLPFMGPCLGTINFILRFVYGKKIIAITDNVIPHEKRPGDGLFTRYFVKSCNGFVAMSRSVLNDLSNFTKNTNKIFLPHPLYNIFGYEVTREEAVARLNLDPGCRYVLFFGFIRKYKGLELLLKAFAKAQLKNVKLIIAGEFYEDSKPYLELMDELNLSGRVILKTNYIPSAEVKYWFCAADLVAQTYLSATQSGVAQIAYYYNKPLLVTNVGGLAEIVPNGKVGYVCEVNEHDVANCLIDFFTYNRAPEFVEGVKREKHRFEWSYFVSGMIKLGNQIS